MNDEDAIGSEDVDAAADRAGVRPLVPRRNATASQALLAIGLVFFFGVLIGFVLARTL